MLERMPTMRAIQVCNAVFAMGRLNLYNAELMDALLQVRLHAALAAVAAPAAMTVFESSENKRQWRQQQQQHIGIGTTNLCCHAVRHSLVAPSAESLSPHQFLCADVYNLVDPTTDRINTWALFLPSPQSLAASCSPHRSR
jgi:hypothetical protein